MYIRLSSAVQPFPIKIVMSTDSSSLLFAGAILVPALFLCLYRLWYRVKIENFNIELGNIAPLPNSNRGVREPSEIKPEEHELPVYEESAVLNGAEPLPVIIVAPAIPPPLYVH